MQINRVQAQQLANQATPQNLHVLSSIEKKVLNTALDLLLVSGINHTYVDSNVDLQALMDKLKNSPRAEPKPLFNLFSKNVKERAEITSKLTQLKNKESSPRQISEIKNRIKNTKSERQLLLDKNATLEKDLQILKAFKELKGFSRLVDPKQLTALKENFYKKYSVDLSTESGKLISSYFEKPGYFSKDGLSDQINKVEKEIKRNKEQIGDLNQNINNYSKAIQKLEANLIENVSKKAELQKKMDLPQQIIKKEREIETKKQIIRRIKIENNKFENVKKKFISAEEFRRENQDQDLDLDKRQQLYNDFLITNKLDARLEFDQVILDYLTNSFLHQSEAPKPTLFSNLIKNMDLIIEKNSQKIEVKKNEISKLRKEIHQLNPNSSVTRSSPELAQYYIKKQPDLINEHANTIEQLRRAERTKSTSMLEIQILEKCIKKIPKNIPAEGLILSNLLSQEAAVYSRERKLIEPFLKEPNPKRAMRRGIEERESLIKAHEKRIDILEKILKEEGIDISKLPKEKPENKEEPENREPRSPHQPIDFDLI